MNEDHFKKIDVTLMYIEEARARAETAASELERAGAEPHLIKALTEAREQLSETQRRLLQRTHFAVPPAQVAL